MTTTPQKSHPKISDPSSGPLDQESLQHGLQLAGARIYTYGETAIVLELEKSNERLAPAKQQCIENRAGSRPAQPARLVRPGLHAELRAQEPLVLLQVLGRGLACVEED